MTLAVWFWLFYVISIVFGIWDGWVPVAGANPYARRGWYVVLYLMLGCLGWKVFGSPVQ